MAVVTQRIAERLADIFGDRVRTDRIERKMYPFDIGAMPRLAKPFVPAGLAGAVVRPKSEDEIVELVDLARVEGLRPSSAPASTVAGWLAQGGAGFGSYEYGAFKENVGSARVPG